MNFELVLYGALGILLIANIYLTIRLIFCVFYDKHQKFMQILIIWLIPLVGFFIVYFFYKDGLKDSKSNVEGNGDIISTSYRGY